MTLLDQWAIQGGFLGLEMDPFFHESSGKSVARENEKSGGASGMLSSLRKLVGGIDPILSSWIKPYLKLSLFLDLPVT